MFAALVGDVGLEHVGVADVGDERTVGEAVEPGDADGGKRGALGEADELRGEAKGGQVKAIGPGDVVLLAAGVAEADIESSAGIEQERITPGCADVGAVDNVAAIGGDAVEVVGEDEQTVAFIEAEESVPIVIC